MDYFISRNETEGFKSSLLRENFTLFNNTSLKRRLDGAFVNAILSELEKSKKIEFRDSMRDAFFIFKVSPAEIAQGLERYAISRAR